MAANWELQGRPREVLVEDELDRMRAAGAEPPAMITAPAVQPMPEHPAPPGLARPGMVEAPVEAVPVDAMPVPQQREFQPPLGAGEQSAEFSVPQVGTGGLSRIQRQLGAASAEAARGYDELGREIDQSQSAMEDAQLAQANADRWRAQDAAAEHESLARAYATHEKKLGDIAEETKAEMRNASLESTYFNAPGGIEQINELIAQRDNKDLPSSTRAAAAAKLKEYSEVDADRILGDTGNKVLAAISMALGAFGSAFTGGPNQAMQIIDSAIKRDIEAQIGRRQALKDRVGQARQEGKDRVEETLMAMDLKYRGVEAKLKEITAKNDALKAEPRMMELFEQTRQKRLDNRRQLIQHKFEAKVGTLGKEASLEGMKMNARAQNAALRAKYAGPAGNTRKPVGEGTAKELAKNEAGKKLVRRLKESFSKVGPEAYFGASLIPGTDAKDYAQRRKASVLQIGKAISGADVPAELYDRIDALLPTPGTTEETAKVQFAELMALFDDPQAALIEISENTGRNPGVQRTWRAQ